MSRTRLSTLAQRPTLHVDPSSWVSFRADRAARAAQQLPEPTAPRWPVLSIPVASHAHRSSLAYPAVRRGSEFQPLRREGGKSAARGAAHLLLLHTDAIRLAHAGGVL